MNRDSPAHASPQEEFGGGERRSDPDRSTPPSDPTDARHPADSLLLSAHSDRRPTLSVVMPTLNEERGIEECIGRIKNALLELDVAAEILVSDSSTDRTPEIAAELGARVISPDGAGYGNAYRYAFERARGEYIAMGDADTTYDFEELPKLFEVVASGEADMVMGTRLGGEIKPGAMPALHQHVGNPLLTRFLNAFYDAGVSDAHSGFRVFSRDAYDRLDLRSEGMEFASEMIMEAGAKGLRIREVPITYHEREGEATLESFTDGWRHVKFMLVNAPGYLFSVPGVLMGVLGTALMALGFSGASVFGQPFGIHSLIAGSLLTMAGYQVGSFGLLTSIAGDPVRETRDPVSRAVHEHFSLERGLVLGASAFVLGSLSAGYLVYQWVESGFTDLPLVSADIVAFTLIVLGIQTVFGAFFMSVLADASERRT